MKITRSSRNPWVMTPLLVLLALVITATAALRLPAHYRAESDVALLPSVSSSKVYGYNPYMSFNGALPMAAQIIAYQLMNPANVQKLKAEGYNQPFTVAMAPTVTNGPILTTEVTGSSKAAVQNTLNGVTREISAEVNALQKGIAHASRITILPVSADLTPKLVVSKTARPLILILAFGLFLAFAIPRMMARERGRVASEIPDRITGRNTVTVADRYQTLDSGLVGHLQPEPVPSRRRKPDDVNHPAPAEPGRYDVLSREFRY